MKPNPLILGVMSGTSLDGIDLALCRFNNDGDTFSYKVIHTGFIPYDNKMKQNLSSAHNLGTYEFLKFHKYYGTFLGKKIKIFLKNIERPDYIASHGHTIFHDPNEKITFQIGDAAFISAETNISVISDFRNLDTALNGQGAPLVPVGDKYLFGEFDYCINLGGFANVSYEEGLQRIAYDICPVNFILNKYSAELGLDYDKDGIIGEKAKADQDLLDELNELAYYKMKHPKSLGREYTESVFYPILDAFKLSVNDKIRTYYSHIVCQIKNSTQSNDCRKILLTGGGTYNKFLISEIEKNINHQLIIPNSQLIDFKEAIIFAFLGFLRISNINNTFKSVTGAKSDSIGGSVYKCK